MEKPSQILQALASKGTAEIPLSYNYEELIKNAHAIAKSTENMKLATNLALNAYNLYSGSSNLLETAAQISKLLLENKEFFKAYLTVASQKKDSSPHTKFQNVTDNIDEVFLENTEADFTNLIENISDSEMQELALDLNVLDSTEAGDISESNWQQKLYAIFEKWQNNNPIIALLIMFILVGVGEHYLLEPTMNHIDAYLHAPAIVREAPEVQAPSITTLRKKEPVVIIEECPYWYKIMYQGNESDDTITGWVSKRSVEVDGDMKLNA